MSSHLDATIRDCVGAIRAYYHGPRSARTVLEHCQLEIDRCADRVEGALATRIEVTQGGDHNWTAMAVAVSLLGDPMVFVASRPYATRQGAEDELLARLKRVLPND